MRVRCTVFVISVLLAGGMPAFGQDHEHPQQSQATSASLFAPRQGSGTAWLPETSEMFGAHRRAGAWELMFHGNAFLQFLYEDANEDRGASQTGSINWVMAMARREMASGMLGLRGMFSLEPATIGGCGYPDLLATGEQCDGESIHDRQHPHDLLMEVAAEYERPLRGGLRWQLYGGLAGEPALGPVAYPHRLSAMANPLAPITHHWLDATHITFGVVTTGVSTSRWKAEASLFNGREPDDERWNLDLAAMNSFSGRVTFAPTAELAVQVSAGHLAEAEAAEGALPRIDVNRATASVTYHRRLANQNLWATTVAWGRNEEHGSATHGFLAESSVTLADRDVWFGRFEVAQKEAHDLHAFEFGDEVFTVGKLQGGFTRYVATTSGMRVGVGGHLSAGLVPAALRPHYGNRANLGVGFFLTIRPSTHVGHAGQTNEHAGHAAAADGRAAPTTTRSRQPTTERGVLPSPATDLTNLKCQTTVDAKTAPRMLHEGRMYYFCSEQERAAFAKDPSQYRLPATDSAAEHKH